MRSSAALIVAGLFYGPSSEPGKIDPLSVIVLSVYSIGALILVLASRHDPAALTVFTLLTVATVAIAWRTDAAAGAVPVAALLASIVILRWALAPEIAHLIAPAGVAGAAAPQPWHADIAPASRARASSSPRCSAPAAFWRRAARDRRSSRSCGAPPGSRRRSLILIALYYRIAGFERSIPFAGLALLLAAFNGFATEELGKRAPRPGIAASGALYATGTVAALALALTFSLEKGWLTVALALMVPGIAWIANAAPAADAALACRRRGGAGGGAGRLGAAHRRQRRRHHADLQLDPLRLRRAGDLVLGRRVICCASAPTTRRRGWSTARAILFTVLTAFLEIRHFMNGGDIYRHASGLGELALQVCTGLAMTIGLEHVRHRTGSIVHDVGALVIAGLTFCAIVARPMADLQSAVHRRAGRRRTSSISSCSATASRRCSPSCWRCGRATFARRPIASSRQPSRCC